MKTKITQRFNAVGLAVGAALAVTLPALFGFTVIADPEVYLRNMPVLVLPFLAAFFLGRFKPDGTRLKDPFTNWMVPIYRERTGPAVEGDPYANTRLVNLVEKHAASTVDWPQGK